MRLNRRGRNRWVIVTRRFAFKFPSLANWRDFLFGLLNNQNERAWAAELPEACPILFALPGGFLNVLPRAEPLSVEEFDRTALPARPGVEMKPDSFGWLNGRLVILDWGWR